MFLGSTTTCLCGQLPARAERLGKTSAEAFPPDQRSVISDENGRLGNLSSWGRFLLCTNDKLTYSAKGPTGVPAQNLSARYLNNMHNSSSRDSARNSGGQGRQRLACPSTAGQIQILQRSAYGSRA